MIDFCGNQRERQVGKHGDRSVVKYKLTVFTYRIVSSYFRDNQFPRFVSTSFKALIQLIFLH